MQKTPKIKRGQLLRYYLGHKKITNIYIHTHTHIYIHTQPLGKKQRNELRGNLINTYIRYHWFFKSEHVLGIVFPYSEICPLHTFHVSAHRVDSVNNRPSSKNDKNRKSKRSGHHDTSLCV